jgi:hypothetical protein
VLKAPVHEASKNEDSSTIPVDKSVGRHRARPVKAKDSLPFPEVAQEIVIKLTH